MPSPHLHVHLLILNPLQSTHREGTRSVQPKELAWVQTLDLATDEPSKPFSAGWKSQRATIRPVVLEEVLIEEKAEVGSDIGGVASAAWWWQPFP